MYPMRCPWPLWGLNGMHRLLPRWCDIIFVCLAVSWNERPPVAKFIDPDWGDKVNSGLSYRPARLHELAGRYDNPMPESTLSPSHGSMNSSTGLCRGGTKEEDRSSRQYYSLTPRARRGFFPESTKLDRKNNIQGVLVQTGQPKSVKVNNISLH